MKTPKLTKEQIIQVKIDAIVQKKLDEVNPLIKSIDWDKFQETLKHKATS